MSPSRSGLAGQPLGWDGVFFHIPDTWNLAQYDLATKLTRLEVEDDYVKRLDVEWTRTTSGIDLGTIQRRYDKQAKDLVAKAEDNRQIDGLPSGWTAFQYRLPDKQRLVVAFHLRKGDGLFLFLRLYFGPEDSEQPRDVLRLITDSFVYQPDPIRWAFYDVDFTLPASFKLFSSTLEAGRKQLTFHQGLRKCYVWHFSLADILLRKHKSAAEFAASFLNMQPMMRGPIFDVDPESGDVIAKRTRRYPLGHFDEIGRWCFRYKIGFEHVEAKNQFKIWVYNYRKEADLDAFTAP